MVSQLSPPTNNFWGILSCLFSQWFRNLAEDDSCRLRGEPGCLALLTTNNPLFGATRTRNYKAATRVLSRVGAGVNSRAQEPYLNGKFSPLPF